MPRPAIRLIGTGIAIAAAVLLAGTSHGQRVSPSKDVAKAEEPKFTEAVSLPRNPESKRLIQAAQDYVKKQEWRIAGECLQSLLETPEDSFIEVTRKTATGTDTPMRVSVRSEANRIIGELPPDGLEAYQLQYGQLAAERLKEAMAAADPTLLAELSQRYFNTKAGQDATNLLGTYQLDRGQYLMASLCFEKLLQRYDPDKLRPPLLFKAALAYRRSGNTAAGDRWFARFADLHAREQTANRSLPALEQYRAEYNREIGTAHFVTSNDWPVYRGNASRTAWCRGSTAYLEPRWTASLISPDNPVHENDKPAVDWINQHLDQAVRLLRDKPIMPAFFPIAANGRLIVRAYDGVAAYAINDTAFPDKKAGELLWRSSPEKSNSLFSIIREDINGKRQKLQDWYTNYYLANNVGPVGVFFEHSVTGAISHDSQRVYYIDDLAVPPHPSMMRGVAFTGMPMNYGPFADDVHFNRLCAADLDSGRLSWTVLGGKSPLTIGPPGEPRGESNAASELRDSFFLGPPLPLGGKLYLLAEKQAELRLICLDPNKRVQTPDSGIEGHPDLVWVQPLGTANEKLPGDGQRRLQVAHLAYGDGILVCPTNAGAVVGVDLLTHSLVWAFSYRKVQQQPPNMEEQIMFNRRFAGPTRGPTIGERWRNSAPSIAKGKVVITAPDSGDLHCLNLRDGQLLWSIKREDADLYLAGVFDDRAVIVSKNHIRAVDCDTGKELWKRGETGTPSGQGVAADGVYYLPLANSADSKTADKGPEICAIDLKTGAIVGRSKSRRDTPGNLLFLEGELIDQNIRTVASYPLLKVKQDEINTALAKNPNDPTGLVERGELHLYNGDARAAVADLRLGLAHQPPAELKTKARAKLHEALTTLFKDDFAAAERYLDEYAQLSEVEIPANAEPATRDALVAERVRRQSVYLELLGRGRERQGRLLEAFAAYEQYGELSGNKELVDSVDEPNTRARPDIWSRGRIQSLLNSANEADRKRLDAEIGKRLSAVRSAAGLDGLRRFVAIYGPIAPTGRAARLELAERLLKTGDPDDLTEAERHLTALCLAGRERRDDPMSAGKATELMMRACIRRGRYDNAVGFCRQLAEEFRDVPVLDKRTGWQVWEELGTDKRFLPYLDAPVTVWTGPLTARRQNGNFISRELSLTLQPQGDLLPVFERHRLVLDVRQDGGPGTWTLRFLDRATNEERWRVPNLPNGGQPASGPMTPPNAHVRGHLLLLQLQEWVIAYDVSERKEVWRFNLLGKDAQLQNEATQMRAFDALMNNVVVPSTDEKKTAVGRIAVADASYVAVLGRDGLTALDPTRPGPSRLWVKSDIPSRVSVFGDDRHLFIFDADAPAGRAKCQALRAQDGATVECADFAEFYKKMMYTLGGSILIAEDQGRAVRLIDALTRREQWRKDFPVATVIARTDEDKLIAAIEPTGQLTLLHALTGTVQLTAALGAERVAKLKDAHVLMDRNRLYVALKSQHDPQMKWDTAMPASRCVLVNGPVIALNRQTGALDWATWDPLPHQALLKEQWTELPVLLFASKYENAPGQGQTQRQGTRVTAIHKATGKLIFDEDVYTTSHFHALVNSPASGKIELIRQDTKVVFASPEAAALPEPQLPVSPRPVNRVIVAPPMILPVPNPRPLPAPPAPGGR